MCSCEVPHLALEGLELPLAGKGSSEREKLVSDDEGEASFKQNIQIKQEQQVACNTQEEHGKVRFCSKCG